MQPIIIHYTEALVRRTVLRYWFRSTGWFYIVAIALTTWWFIQGLWDGDRSWSVGVSGTVAMVGILFALMLYIVHFRRSISKFRRLEKPEGLLELAADKMSLTADTGLVNLRWDSITEIQRYPEAWLVFLAPGQFVTLPTADLTNDARSFILDKTKTLKIKIR